jgi:cyclopropane-fatty-acyl-phospholipid synthase
MKSVSLASDRHLAGTPKPRTLDVIARRLVLRQLDGIRFGRLTLIDGDQVQRFGHSDEFEATINVHTADFYADIAFGGSIGAGEAYMRGAWSCNDLVGLVRLLLRNRHVVEGMEGGLAYLTRPLQKVFHWVNRNTREGARRNISAHYDLGNDFFGLWLDQSMMYSSAIFERPGMSLHAAQMHRLDTICRKLDLKSVPAGAGWPSMRFSITAAVSPPPRYRVNNTTWPNSVSGPPALRK